MAFRGFPPEALAFFAGLEADNSKRYWQANKDTYESAAKAPMLELLAEVPDEWQPMHIFRPNRDVRFSSDKTPYKTHIAAVGEREGGAICYVHLSATGLFAGAGYYHMASDQLERYRHAVDNEKRGSELASIVARLEKARWEIAGSELLKTAPRGYPRDHPRVELLRRKGLVVAKTFPIAAWLRTRSALGKIVGVWEAGEPVNAWLDAHVGPSILAPDDIDG